MRLIDGDKIEKFIEDGLNNPDKLKAFGHDAIEIMAQVHYAPTIEAEPVKHGKWELHKDGSGTCDQCHFTQKNVWDYDNAQRYCGVCGAKMDGDNV